MHKLRKSATLIISSAIDYNLASAAGSSAAASALETSSSSLLSANQHDYQVMFLKRNDKMRVAPHHHVFPGGKYDPSVDGSIRWLELLLNREQRDLARREPHALAALFCGLMHSKSIGTLAHVNETMQTTAASAKNNHNNNLTSLPSELSFRLCAIREAFEETGLLLAHKISLASSPSQLKSYTLHYTAADESDSHKLKQWCDLVRKDSANFLSMCLDMGLVPDVHGLHEWSNWITPPHEKHRFNTIFFSCFLKHSPVAELCNINRDEIDSLEFITPAQTMDRYVSNEIKFIPPQLYEIERISKFKRLAQLCEFSARQHWQGLAPFMPKFTRDLTLALLPGDYMYERMDENDPPSTIVLNELNSKRINSGVGDKAEPIKMNRILKRIDQNNNVKYTVVCNFNIDESVSKVV